MAHQHRAHSPSEAAERLLSQKVELAIVSVVRYEMHNAAGTRWHQLSKVFLSGDDAQHYAHSLRESDQYRNVLVNTSFVF